MDRVIFHVDLDAFYASVEQLDNPALKGRPVIVGARPGTRGVVSACSYEARRYGIHSAMPITQAHRRCPHGVYLIPRMERYVEMSERVMAILADFTPALQQISIDEAFLDLTGTRRLLGAPREVAGRLKARVREETGLALSVGIAANKYLAKIASDSGKPDGLVQVSGEQAADFLDGLPLAKLWGVGEKTLERLAELNITTVHELRSFSEDILCSMMGEAGGRFLYRAARGQDPGIFPAEAKSRSISSEVTFETDRKDEGSIRRALLDLSQQVMARLIRGRWQANTVTLKLRYWDFSNTTVQKTMKHWLTSSDEIYRMAIELLGERWDGSTPVRLVGVGTANVVSADEPRQRELFPDEYDKKRKVEEAVTRLREKMADLPLTRASLLGKRRGGQPPRGPAKDGGASPTP
jgi:DNA polymerase-4